MDKTLRQLEGKANELAPEGSSYLVKTVFELFDKKIEEFEIEDLRIMISQGEGLNHLVPLAIIKLEENIFAEGDYYPGDLLKSILSIKQEYWKENPEQKEVIGKLFLENKKGLDELDLDEKLKDKIFEAFNEFY
jgi:hypothetical protein